MKTVGDLVRGREVFFVTSDSTVLETVHHLVEKNIGAVPVLEDGRLAGIFSERDLMTKVIVKGRDPGKVSVGEVMTRDMIVARVDEPVESCEKRMSRARIRHVPVVEGDRMVGFISLRDLLEVEISAKSEEIQYLTSYIHFQPPGLDEDS
jgi:CBS domain-containing protein